MSNFLADLLANTDAHADPEADARAAADAARASAANTVAICRHVLAAAIREYGYGTRSDAAATRLRAAEARLARLS